MKLSRLLCFIGTAGLPQIAAAGGLFLPGAGAVSTSRAGAAVASADDGEALVLNPAGLAKSTGTTITVSAAMLSYAMEFQRRGTYDAVDGQTYPYAGQPFALAKNDPSPPLGIGSVQPVPVIAVISDLGGVVPGLHVALGFYAPNAYPFRNMCIDGAGGCRKPVFTGDPNLAPLSTRYDIVEQEAAILAPSLGVAYRVIPQLDVGLRLSAARADLKSTTGLWGTLNANYQEDIQQDGQFTVDASDSFIPTFGVGVNYRPTPSLEVAANYSYKMDIHAKGTATSILGANAGSGLPVVIAPVTDAMARCAPGGTLDELKACVDLSLPMTAQLAGRYKFLDAAGKQRGDVELDLMWENWGKSCSAEQFKDGSCTSPSDYRVVVDGIVSTRGPDGTVMPLLPRPLQDAAVRHGLQDTFGVRVGGSYVLPVGAEREDKGRNEVILRGGLGYETAAAKTGWLRADLDGAARTTITVGAAYRMRRLEISAGGGVILEGSPSNPNVGGGAPCNPTQAAPHCTAADMPPFQGPSPVNPILDAEGQAESPVAQGDYKAHYTMFMLGVTTWF
jgi:long-subunit fatty acid transport protein